ncbi:MAG: hypothetical protein KAJ07_12145 [Planctomycetes bacterium]|nr:hypothetical protein [Planctomycetota bacterium]
MLKKVRIHEVGTVTKYDETYLCLQVVVSHKGHVTDRKIWLAHFDTPTETIATIIMDEYLADSYEYQTMWFHPDMDVDNEQFKWVEPLG